METEPTNPNAWAEEKAHKLVRFRVPSSAICAIALHIDSRTRMNSFFMDRFCSKEEGGRFVKINKVRQCKMFRLDRAQVDGFNPAGISRLNNVKVFARSEEFAFRN